MTSRKAKQEILKKEKKKAERLKDELLTINVDEWINKLWFEDSRTLILIYNYLNEVYKEKIKKSPFIMSKEFSTQFVEKPVIKTANKYSVIKDIITMHHFYKFYMGGDNSNTQTELEQILVSVQRVRANVDEVLGTAGDPGDQTLEEPHFLDEIKGTDPKSLLSIHIDKKLGNNNLEKSKNMLTAIQFFAPEIENKVQTDWYSRNVLGELATVISRLVKKKNELLAE